MSKKTTDNKGNKTSGSGRSSPFPVSRLSPAIHLVDLAREIAEADKMLNARVSSKLKVIADQIKALQEVARSVLQEAQMNQELNHAKCNFTRKPGHIYHLYGKDEGSTYFSMLSPKDWKDKPPHKFIWSFRLENDFSWTSLDEDNREDDTRDLVEHLLSAHNNNNR